MKTIEGKYRTAVVYTDLIEDTARKQIKTLCDQPFADNCRIAIMPNVHSTSGFVSGFTAKLGPLVIPNMVGVDIGCGILTVCLGQCAVDFEKLDCIIRKYVPAGINVYSTSIKPFEKLSLLKCYSSLKDIDWIKKSVGTLGSGNHFIEVDVDNSGNYYLVIHAGSLNIGKQVTEHYQLLATNRPIEKDRINSLRRQLIENYKKAGREIELLEALEEFNKRAFSWYVPKEFCYLSGKDRIDYLHDMKICQDFAAENRKTIANEILSHLLKKTLDDFEWFETIHNYIDHDLNIIRKGAVSAQKGERLLIPLNMRDGSLICIGKGNPDWNYSAPHGAGRLFSRSVARKSFSVKEFAAVMDGIYTTSISDATLDECPMAYKPMDSIINNISPTVEIESIIRSVYNFKAGKS